MINKLLSVLTALHPDIPVYGDDITEEERRTAKTFFIYRDPHLYTKSAEGRGLYRDFHLYFLTMEQKEIDIGELIAEIEDRTTLRLKDTDEDFGKMEDTDQTALMVSMYFRRLVRKC